MQNLTLERSFKAPIEKVWEAFKTADKLSKWWSPPTFDASNISVDFKEGGMFLYCFKSPEGQEFWGRGIYQTINEPKMLSWLDSFSDSEGNPVPSSHYGIPGDEVIESLVEITLSENNGTTSMKMDAENPYDESMLQSMTDGWNGMFDKLEELLEQSV